MISDKITHKQAYEATEYSPCPMCTGEGHSLGYLGNRQHFRCRQCGMEFSGDEYPPTSDEAK